MRTPAGRKLANTISEICPVEDFLAAENEARLTEYSHQTRTNLRKKHRAVMKHLDGLEAALNDLEAEVRDILEMKKLLSN